MKCSSCGDENSKVVDSRISDGGTSIRRRRECEKCGFRFTTFERMQTTNLMVEKQDGTLEAYDREKLERGVMIACGKRPVQLQKIQEKLGELEEKWAGEKTLKSKKIGEDVVEMLRETDEIAFIRFASVYKKFKDVDTFKKEFSAIFDQDKK